MCAFSTKQFERYITTANVLLGLEYTKILFSTGNSQGGVLGRFFRQGGGLGCGGAACDFSVAFNTAGVPPGGADFCHNEPCVNPTDEPIFQAGGPALAPPPGRLRRSASPSPAYFYKTASGLELSSPNDLAIGSRTIEIKPRNLTLLLERSNEIVADESSLEERGLLDDDDMYETVHDTIVARLEAPAKRSPVNDAPEPRTVPEFQNVATQPFEPRDNPDCSIFQCLKDIGSTIKDATDCFQPDNPKADIECALGVPIKTIEAIATCTKCKVISGGCPNGGNSTQSGAPANPFDRNCGVNGDRPVLDGPGKCSEADGQVGAKAGDKVLGGRLWHCSNTGKKILCSSDPEETSINFDWLSEVRFHKDSLTLFHSHRCSEQVRL